ncbi:transposase family protein [Streptomyces niveus]|uniref:transposase family protein n=1 Tax=Streptomyces niveus TaxID=193462 RepID=UPI003865A8DF
MRDVLLRLEGLLFLADPGTRVESVQDDGEVIRVGVRCRTAGARCPGCGSWSGRLHGSYLRFPTDLPVVAGRRVVLRLRVRRFTCEDVSCVRRTFVEQVAGLTRRYSQRTERMRSAPAEVGLALAGRAGARLADVFGARVGRNTVLRLVDALPEPQPQVPRVVGVDEYAMRKGRVYGTVLHWGDDPEGRGALFSGDIFMVVMDRRWVSFMYSIPNFIPERPRTIRRALALVEPFTFERIYGAFWGRVVTADGAAGVRRSAERYLRFALEDDS